MVVELKNCKFLTNLDSFRYIGTEEYDFCYSIVGDYDSYGEIDHGDIVFDTINNELCLILKNASGYYYRVSDLNVKVMTLNSISTIKEVKKYKLKKVNLFLRIRKNEGKDLLVDDKSIILFLLMKLNLDITNINLLI